MSGLEKCAECKWFRYTDVPKEKTAHDYPTQRKDGWCSKVFPKGYLGAGKEGGYCFSGKLRCFQFDKRDESQINLFDQKGERHES